MLDTDQMENLKTDDYALTHFGYDLLKQVFLTTNHYLKKIALMINALKNTVKSLKCVSKLSVSI